MSNKWHFLVHMYTEEDRHGSKVLIKVLHWRMATGGLSLLLFFSASNQYWGYSADLVAILP